MNVGGPKYGYGIVGCAMVQIGVAENIVGSAFETGAWRRITKSIPGPLNGIGRYPHGINRLDIWTLAAPPDLGINLGNPGIALCGFLPLDHAFHISSMQRRNILFYSAVVDSGSGITDVGQSSGLTIGR